MTAQLFEEDTGNIAQEDFQHNRGSLFERLLFEHRNFVIGFFIIATLFLGYNALGLKINASFYQMLPTQHPYVKNFIKHKEFKGLSNSIRVVVETKKEKNIFTAEYLNLLREVHDAVSFIGGVDRGEVKSLWAPAITWSMITEDGFAGGPVIDGTFAGTPQEVGMVQRNVYISRMIGYLVGKDQKSAMVQAPILDNYQDGTPIDYKSLSDELDKIRAKYQNENYAVRITGFGKMTGDLIGGMTRELLFFAISFVLLLVFFYWYQRSLRSTFVRAISSTVAMVWLLGILRLLGYGLNPYFMLVPFMLFAIGASHGIQINNAVIMKMIKGADKISATRMAWRKILKPGLVSLITSVLVFAALLVIIIGVIHHVAIGAALGAVVILFTEFMLVPILTSYVGVGPKAIEKRKEIDKIAIHRNWYMLAKLVESKYSIVIILCAVNILGLGLYLSRNIQIGDTTHGVSEFRKAAPYNNDIDYLRKHYPDKINRFVSMLKTPKAGNSNYNAIVATDRLQMKLRELRAIKSTDSIADQVKMLSVGMSQANFKWAAIPRSQESLNSTIFKLSPEITNRTGEFSPITTYLPDLKASTLKAVTGTIALYAHQNKTDEYEFWQGGGNAGIISATNQVIEKTQLIMAAVIFGAIILVFLMTYRSLRGTLCIVIPLLLTFVLCKVLMIYLQIGLKVSTLPILAVGVGIGIDYGIYIYHKMNSLMKEGLTLVDAYYQTLMTTGKSILFTAVVLSLGLGTWIFSPIKFQADMGLLLALMIIANAIGATILLPALMKTMGITAKAKCELPMVAIIKP